MKMNRQHQYNSQDPAASENIDSGAEITAQLLKDRQDEIDRALDHYEQLAQQESVYLLESSHHIPSRYGLVIKTGVSPSRTFGASVTLADIQKVPNISVNFGYYQWVSFIQQLKHKCKSFFEQPLDQHSDDYEPISYKCDDYITITQMVYEDTKMLCVERCKKYIYMEEANVRDLLDYDENMNSPKMWMLEKIEFSMYFHNVIDLVREIILYNNNNDNNNDINPMDLLHCFCNVSHSIQSICLREYLFYYKDNVINVLNNKIC